MQIRQNKGRITQPILVAFFVFLGSFACSAFLSHSFTPTFYSSANSSDINVDIEPSLSLTIMDKDPNIASDAVAIDTMAMNATPSASGVFVSNTAYVVAGSNNETGYTLSMSDTDNDTALNYQGTLPAGSSSSSTSIPSVATTSTSLSNIEANRWGYAFGTTTLGSGFNPIPALSTPINLAITSIPQSNTYPFTVATKIDSNIVAGTYQDNLIFSLVANFVPNTDIVFNNNQSSYNSATTISGTMNGVDLGYNKKVTLPTNTLSRPGYRFLGWDTDANAITATYADGATLDYNDVNGSSTTSSTLTLYAI